ncbi:hypothetical protein MPTK1_1g25270 [Marchantia polymorpha subsp. ruderalis]|uniref:Uncharacterized protein n=2 Tax=Marchantia polymorpha TaxID=3197 RepID=A0A176WL25_MARPO|nr:hypothetical protein AXG93_1200s1850 [Marchantia polymorpha subsp. ruderalis]PTQ49909.1 hypothetical protein MARPO_0002s0344 [Marchantia polymorpha]BBM99970.1 hypothetical protein Mp_1g25270 [Marchantia polymorpha subsp. ruderalis]|eukprot:PTQ49909.1 hypothetical protein MARPO_0002s0344 [Marchantia polymorpha]
MWAVQRRRERATLVVALLVCCAGGRMEVECGEKLYTKSFFSPVFETSPGNVFDRFQNVEFPEGHLAVRSFTADMFDADTGQPISLSELYLHHWLLLKFAVKKGFKELLSSAPLAARNSTRRYGSHYLHNHMERMAFRPEAQPLQGPLKGRQVCHEDEGPQSDHAFGTGAESRHTKLIFPAPYGVVTGDKSEYEEGYEEAWYLNVHSIDLRGVVDPRGCFECACHLYNVTVDYDGFPLPDGYKGGLRCCYHLTNCALKPGVQDKPRRVQMKYTISWVEYDDSVRPLRCFVLDATDTRASVDDTPDCKAEYDIPKCTDGTAHEECIHTLKSVEGLPKGGDLIFAFLHQHSGGLGGRVFNEAGEKLCESLPIYGQGNEAGNEAGFVVGMSPCYPKPGSVKIRTMEALRVESDYSSVVSRTGVMGNMKVYVADTVTEELDPLAGRDIEQVVNSVE